jgi:hypothetical protein
MDNILKAKNSALQQQDQFHHLSSHHQTSTGHPQQLFAKSIHQTHKRKNHSMLDESELFSPAASQAIPT